MTNQGRRNGKTAEAISILNAKVSALTAENAELSRKLDVAEHNERDLRDSNKRLKHDKKVMENQAFSLRESLRSCLCELEQATWEHGLGCDTCRVPGSDSLDFCDFIKEAVGNG